MSDSALTVEDLQHAIRVRICADCPNRTAALDAEVADCSRPCEATCALFTHLESLHQIAIDADPVISHRTARICHTARAYGGAARWSARKVVTTVEELLEP